jgi:hypothetical protein
MLLMACLTRVLSGRLPRLRALIEAYFWGSALLNDGEHPPELAGRWQALRVEYLLS